MPLYPMDTKLEPTVEELAAEQAELKLPSEDEVRAGVIEDYGFDADTDKERIDKIVKKDLEQRTKLQKTIQQKIKHRTAAQEASKINGGKKEEPTAGKADLSTDDVFTLVKAGVAQEDVAEVRKYAKMEGISIAEALQSTVVKTILKQKTEERNVAEATNTGTARRSTGKVSDEALLANASKGEMPESDEDMQRLIKLRKGFK